MEQINNLVNGGAVEDVLFYVFAATSSFVILASSGLRWALPLAYTE